MAHLRKAWDHLCSAFWPVPVLMLALSLAGAALMLAVDERHGGSLAGSVPRLVQVSDAQAARTMLGTLSTSLASVAGVTFSIVVVALVMAASQYGSRVIRLCMRDRWSQFALGALLGAFSYCIVIMGAVGGSNGGALPTLSLSMALVLSLGALLVWTFFIHHVAMLLQSESICAAIHLDFDAAVRALVEGDGEAGVHVECPAREPGRLAVGADGYIQTVDRASLVRAARREGALIRLLRRPGHFVRGEDTVALVWPAEKAPALRDEVAAALSLGKQRTYAEDLEYAVEQLVQMAVRALSPGINDFFTAEACIDWLSAGLQRLAGCGDGRAAFADDEGRPRLVLPPWRAHRVAAAAFDPIREAARGNVAVTIRLIEAVKAVGISAKDDALLAELGRQTDMLERSLSGVPERQDRRDGARRVSAARQALRSRSRWK